jgi:DNA modification methylase
MNGQQVDMVFTSPPYNGNVKASPDIFGTEKSVDLYEEKIRDDRESEEYIEFVKDVLEACFEYTDGFIFWNVSYNAKSRFEYIKQIEDRIEYLIEQICWRKTASIPFKGSLRREWEPIYLFSTNKETLGCEEVTSNFWQIDNQKSQNKVHKACFPVDLPSKALSIVKPKTLLEPFGGSGTTMIACEKAGVKCFMMELSEVYCDVILKRWEDFTGKVATHEETGKTIAQIQKDRA